MKAIIPVGGFGTRFGADGPKALLKLNDKPIIEHILKKLEGLPVDNIYIASNDRYYPNFNNWFFNYTSIKSLKKSESTNLGEAYNLRKGIMLLNDGSTCEENRLGQIGNIYHTLNEKQIKFTDDVLIIAGDNIFDFSLAEPYKYFMEKKKIVNVIYDIKSKEEAKRFGVVLIDKNGLITDFQEKPTEPKSALISVGIYFFPGEKLQLFDWYKNNFRNEKNAMDKIGTFFQKCLECCGEEIYGWTVPNSYKWFDIGSKGVLDEAKEYFRR